MKLGWLDTATVRLHSGNHDFEEEDLNEDTGIYYGAVCLLEACYMASEDPGIMPDYLSDEPVDVHTAFACFGRQLNDCFWPDSETRTHALLPLIPLLLKTSQWGEERVFKALGKIADAVNPRIISPMYRDESWEGIGPTTFANVLGEQLEQVVKSSTPTRDEVAYLEGIARAFVDALGAPE